MSAEAPAFLLTVAIGLGATLFMDLWTLFLKHAFKVPSANYCLVGRWFCHMPERTFMHASIANASQKRFECAAGWTAHYVIGVVYALLFVALVSDRWLEQPRIFSALLFGVVTVVVPFLVMQPAFGLGVAASETPEPTQARLRSFMAHISAIGMSCVVQSHA